MPESKKKWLLPLVILGGAVLAAMAIVALRPEPATAQRPEVLPIVEVLTVQPTDVVFEVSAQGTVQASTETTLVAQVAGEIRQVGRGLADGALVRSGDLLAVIDPRDYQLAVTRSEAQLAQAQLGLNLEQARSEIAREEWSELGKGEASPLAAREPQIAEAQAAVAAAQANLQQAQLALSRTTIRAPYNSRVRTKLADRGQYVGPGTPVAQLVSTDRAEIPLAVAQEELQFLNADFGTTKDLNIPVDLTLDGSNHWQAQVIRAAGEIDPRSRMMTLTARIEDPLALQREGKALPLGSFVTASIRGLQMEGLFVLPRSALRGQNRVLILEDGRLNFRPVTILRIQPDQVLVRSGLQAGDQVCTSAIEAPVDGMRVVLQAVDSESQDVEAESEVRP